MKETMGARIHRLRLENDMSQEELADAINKKLGTSINRSSISKYERNVSYPEIEKIVVLADMFNVSVDYLLGRTHIRRHDWYLKLPKEVQEFVDEKNVHYLEIASYFQRKGITKAEIEEIINIINYLEKYKK